MALASAAVLGLMNSGNRRRALNCRRVACRTTESVLTSSRLLANDIQRLAVEYRDWRFYTKHNLRQGFYTRVQQLDLKFGVTLWCKTLVLRKDKVTHCVLFDCVVTTKPYCLCMTVSAL